MTLLGPNGAGKSTLLKAVFRLVEVTGGSVMLGGNETTNRPAAQGVTDGMGFVPQGSRVFAALTVRENLEVGGFSLRHRRLLSERLSEVLALFPDLAEFVSRQAGTLSGGEKQMVAMGRALMTRPRLLLLDEPSLGLSPAATQAATDRIQSLARDTGTAVLMVEQNVTEALRVADRVYVLVLGRVVLEATTAAISESDLRQAFFGRDLPVIETPLSRKLVAGEIHDRQEVVGEVAGGELVLRGKA